MSPAGLLLAPTVTAAECRRLACRTAPEAREALINALAKDAMALLVLLDGRRLIPEVAQTAELRAAVVGQDLEEEDGAFRIARRVAPTASSPRWTLRLVPATRRTPEALSIRAFPFTPRACWSMSRAIRLGLVPEMLPAERHLAEDLSADPSPMRRLLLEVLTTRDDADRARRIGELYSDDRSRPFAEFSIDLEEEPAARALVVGTLREVERASEG